MWEYILLGALQGIFEWIPVSSEGVVAIFSNYLVKDFNSVDLALFLHLGTVLAVIVYFWRDWISLALFKDKEFLRFFIIVTFISGTLGFFVYKMARDVSMGSGLLALTGLGLLLTSWFQKKNIKLNINKDLSSIIVGLLQAISAIPGVSRSGSTVFGLSLTENNPTEILKKSYIISVPVVLGSSLYLYLDNPTIASSSWIAVVFSFIFGIISLKILLDFSKKVNFSKFTLIFGLLCLIGALFQFLM
ncbi:MAG TPA: undecaprenyl-diphosphate phosphatase [Candidatus Pacearchaeota archaeon]|nr:undecaprenyl-diphosphate phosphatase [Candidatus Pacearchaeota archaeon]HPR80001.1 undecaprenyl-diphosphate phosphatase [Candidatus Pacearchaeota archaeon]